MKHRAFFPHKMYALADIMGKRSKRHVSLTVSLFVPLSLRWSLTFSTCDAVSVMAQFVPWLHGYHCLSFDLQLLESSRLQPIILEHPWTEFQLFTLWAHACRWVEFEEI